MFSIGMFIDTAPARIDPVLVPAIRSKHSRRGTSSLSSSLART